MGRVIFERGTWEVKCKNLISMDDMDDMDATSCESCPHCLYQEKCISLTQFHCVTLELDGAIWCPLKMGDPVFHIEQRWTGVMFKMENLGGKIIATVGRGILGKVR